MGCVFIDEAMKSSAALPTVRARAEKPAIWRNARAGPWSISLTTSGRMTAPAATPRRVMFE
jgi:hypothetical protein